MQNSTSLYCVCLIAWASEKILSQKFASFLSFGDYVFHLWGAVWMQKWSLVHKKHRLSSIMSLDHDNEKSVSLPVCWNAKRETASKWRHGQESCRMYTILFVLGRILLILLPKTHKTKCLFIRNSSIMYSTNPSDWRPNEIRMRRNELQKISFIRTHFSNILFMRWQV